MASALETLCGQAYGAKQYQMLGIYLQRSWIVLFLCSILLLPMFLFATPILKLIGQPAEVAEQTGLVAIWLIPFHFSLPFHFTLQRFLQSQLKTGIIAWICGGALLIHVLVSWFFVYRLKAGIVATAITLDFSWWVSVWVCFVIVFVVGVLLLGLVSLHKLLLDFGRSLNSLWLLGSCSCMYFFFFLLCFIYCFVN